MWVGSPPPQPNGANPTITFNFGTDVTITSLRIHVDNVGSGGVRAPRLVRLSNASQVAEYNAVGAVVFGQQRFIEINVPSFRGSSLAVGMFQDGNNFIMASEFQFFGITSAVPEPSTWLMLVLGLGFVGGAMRVSRVRACSRAAFI